MSSVALGNKTELPHLLYNFVNIMEGFGASMTKKERSLRKAPAIIRKADKALKVAVAKVVEDRRKSGDPLVVWRNGKVVKIPANRLSRPA